MSKIVRAVNAMIAHPEKIGDVTGPGDELYFLFDDKYSWSILRKSGEVDTKLYLYPNGESPEYLSQVEGWEWDQISVVAYDTKDINTKEARDSFAELYTIVKERRFGVDEVLDHIINKFEDF